DSASDHGHLEERLARLLTALADSFGDFIRFSETNTYASLFIAYDDKSREAKATPAFDYLRHAVDMNDPLAELVVVEIFECHDESLLEVSSRQEHAFVRSHAAVRSSALLHGRPRQEPSHDHDRGSRFDRRPLVRSCSWHRSPR